MRVPMAFLDANVLRDWICLTALESPGLFQPAWSQSVLNEWQYWLRRNHPEQSESWITRYRDKLEQAFPDSLVSEFEVRRPSWMQDKHDAHVHCAAVAAGAHYLVTSDNGWDAAPLDSLPYEVHTPGSFLCLCAESQVVLMENRVADQMAHSWRQRRGDSIDIVEPLRRAGAPEFAEWVRNACQRRSVMDRFEKAID